MACAKKSQFKSLRSEVDILTLTATPIPRTLNMAMSGIRDLSIIATPPAKRLSVKTFVRQHDSSIDSKRRYCGKFSAAAKSTICTMKSAVSSASHGNCRS